MTGRSEEEDELARRMQQVFCLMDTDDGGTITTSEIESLMQLLGVDVSNQELEDLIGEVDTNGSGELEREEFVEMMSHKPKPPNSMTEVLHCFRVLAGRNDLGYGKINHEALTSQMTKIGRDPMTPEESKQLTRQLEPLNDGTINYERYVLMTLRHNTNANPVLSSSESNPSRRQNEMISHQMNNTPATRVSTPQRHRGPTECHVIETDSEIHRQYYNIKRPDIGLARSIDGTRKLSPIKVETPTHGARFPSFLSYKPTPKLKRVKHVALRDKLADDQKKNGHVNLVVRKWE